MAVDCLHHADPRDRIEPLFSEFLDWSLRNAFAARTSFMMWSASRIFLGEIGAGWLQGRYLPPFDSSIQFIEPALPAARRTGS
jgi:hypothetical protein